ncbi:hypothetical protein N2152v2_007864 [Parachlorella kessleri]
MATAGHMKHNRGAHHLSQKVAGEQPVWMEADEQDVSTSFEDPPLTASLAGLKLESELDDSAAALVGPLEGPAEILGPPVEEFQARLDHALEALEGEVGKAGEALVELGASAGGYGPTNLSEPQLDAVIKALGERMERVNADVTVLRRRKVPAPVLGASDCWVADASIRLRPGGRPAVEVRVAIIGNVDSGKSTMVGVLTRSILDDGRGLARSKVFKHGHEEDTGRTSSIGQHTLCLGSRGEILNDPSFKTLACADYVAHSAKVVTLVDLAGHEKYFKTTAYGLTGHMPDYACLIVGANAGIVGMCKEHLGVALALKVPVFFVITKVDICPDHILKHSLQALQTILKKPGVRKKPFLVRTRDDVVTCARHIHSDSLAPIFLTSSVTGQGLDLIRLFYSLLPQRQNWYELFSQPAEFIIDETFSVSGVGTVVAGTVKRGVITPNTPLLLGPDPGDASFKAAAVKSIHYKRLPVCKAVAGQTAALALKRVKRSSVRKGMVLVDERVHPRASWEFEAEIAILTHATTIQPKYQAVIHCEIVRQAAQVVAMDQERLRSGDRAHVRFRFLQRPEFLTPGSRFVFREGRTKGIGMVVRTEMGS